VGEAAGEDAEALELLGLEQAGGVGLEGAETRTRSRVIQCIQILSVVFLGAVGP
jgi:hypothetical protein